MATVTGWIRFRQQIAHAVLDDSGRAACGVRLPQAATIVLELPINARRCRSCLRIVYQRTTPKPLKGQKPALFRGARRVELLTYLGWSRGLYDTLAHHLIVIDEYHQQRAACHAPFYDKKLYQPGDAVTRPCGNCLRSDAYTLYGGAPFDDD